MVERILTNSGESSKSFSFDGVKRVARSWSRDGRSVGERGDWSLVDWVGTRRGKSSSGPMGFALLQTRQQTPGIPRVG